MVRRMSWKDAAILQAHEIDQVLGKALGYPWYYHDQKNFPGATEADGVCTGEHVPETLVAEAAGRIAMADRLLVRCLGALQQAQDYMTHDGRSIKDIDGTIGEVKKYLGY